MFALWVSVKVKYGFNIANIKETATSCKTVSKVNIIKYLALTAICKINHEGKNTHKS